MSIPDNSPQRNKVCTICGILYRDRSAAANMTYCGATACAERRARLHGARLRALYKADPARPKCAWCGQMYADAGSRWCAKCAPVAGRAVRDTQFATQRPVIGSSLGARMMGLV